MTSLSKQEQPISFGRRDWVCVASVMLLALLLRGGLAVVLYQPGVSDWLAYKGLASNVLGSGTIIDNAGRIAFYSPGFAFSLLPFFATFGISDAAGVIACVIYSVTAVALVYFVALRMTENRLTAICAGTLAALYLPLAAAPVQFFKENFSAVLVLLMLLVAVRYFQARSTRRFAFAGGILYGAVLLTHPAAILTVSGYLVAGLLRVRRGFTWKALTRDILIFAVGTAIIAGPWLAYVDRQLGKPVLTTNGGFNLYLGNNPAANGWFVSIGDTPAATDWHNHLKIAGELGATEWLKHQALDYMQENPGRTVALGLRKLAYFWSPNFPDEKDRGAGTAVLLGRIVAGLQYIAIALLGLGGFWLNRRRPEVAIAFAIAASFWLLHAVAYIIPRYREPIMPIFIIAAALVVAQSASVLRDRLGSGKKLTA